MNGIAMTRLGALVLVGAGAAAQANETVVQAQGVPTACVARTQRGDLREYVCALPAARPRHFKVVAHFSGSHDDTLASLSANHDGTPVACDAGSRTRTMGEDGDVSLDCRFALADAGSGRGDVVVVVRWSHAEFVGFEAFSE